MGLEAWKAGRVPTSFAFSTASKTDLKTLTPLSYIAIFGLLAVLLRSFWLAVALFCTVLLAIVSTLGLAGWLGLQINAATSSTPTMILSLGVAAFIHLVISVQGNFSEATDLSGGTKAHLITQAMITDMPPIALTLITTAIGFLTLNFADAPPFRELGNLVSLGSIFCLFFALLFLPAMLRLLPARAARQTAWLHKLTNWMSGFILKRRVPLLILTPIIMLACITGMSRITIDDNYIRYFSEKFEFRRHSDAVQTHLTGLDHIEFDVNASTSEGVLTPDYFTHLTRFENWLQDQPKVSHVTSIAETFRRLNQHLNGGGQDQYIIPDDPALLAQYLVAYEMSLPFGRSMNEQITLDRSRSRVSVIMADATTQDVQRLREQGEAWLSENTPSHITGSGTGLAVMYAYLSSLNIQSMTTGTIMALILISTILMLAFRNFQAGLISLLPNLLPGLMAFGLWGFLVGEVGVAASAVGALTLGIIVDDTVHLLWRYREARKFGASPGRSGEENV